MKYTIKNDVAKELCEKLSLLKTAVNSVKLLFGISDHKDFIANKAVIVNGGIMEEITFTSSRPKKDGELEQETVVVSAASFTSYLSALIGYNSDISVDVSNKVLTLAVGTQVKIPLPVKEEKEMDILLPQDLSSCVAKVAISPSALQSLLHVGSSFSKPGVDDQGLHDRVVVRIDSSNMLYAYSTDLTSIAKAWCAAPVELNDGGRALLFLKSKGAELDDAGMEELLKKMNEAKDPGTPEEALAFLKDKCEKMDEAGRERFILKMNAARDSENPQQALLSLASAERLIELASVEGMPEDHSISIPASCINIILSILKGQEENASLRICENYLYMKAENIMATFALASGVPSIYKASIDGWETSESVLKVTFDKEAFIRALSVLKLGEASVPVSVTADSKQLVISKNKDTVNVPFSASEGELDKVAVNFATEKLLNAVSRLDNGNCTLKLFSGKIAPCFSNGDLEGNGAKSYLYVFPVKK